MSAYPRKQTLTIANGATVSDAFDASNTSAFGMQLPAAFTGTTITYQVSADGGTTFQALYDHTGATQISTAVAASRSYDLPAELAEWTHFKLVSGSAEGGTRLIPVIGKSPS